MDPTGNTCSERSPGHWDGAGEPERAEPASASAADAAAARGSGEAEQGLAHRLAARDGSALAELVERYEPMLRRLVGRLCAWSADSEDLVQDVFLRAWERAGSHRGGSLGGWLRTIAIRRCHNHFRGLSVVRRHLHRVWLGTARRAEPPAGEPVELAETTRAALQSLRPADRTVLVLHYLEELSLEEVAQVLGLRAATVSVRLHRARERLKEQFAAKAGGADSE